MTREDVLDGFTKYLVLKSFSSSTKKNYLSDVRLFLSWLPKDSPLITQLADIDQTTLQSYLSWLKTSEKSPTSINRALAALRQFFTFARHQQWIITNPAKKVNNINPRKKIDNKKLSQPRVQQRKLLDKFATCLKEEGLSESTVKNYLSDIQCFTKWLEKETNT